MMRSMTPGEELAHAVETFLVDRTSPNREGELCGAYLVYIAQTLAPDRAPPAKQTARPPLSGEISCAKSPSLS